MAGERQAEATASTTSPGTAASTESGAGGRRDQVTVRSPPPETMTGGEDDGEGQADAESPDHRGGLSPRATTYAPEAAGETDLTEAATEAKGPLTLDDIEGHVLRAIRYHEARARFLDFWRRVFDFLVVLLGAGAVTFATQGSSFWSAAIGVVLAAIGALQLVAGFSEKSGEHASLKRRFCAVLADITEARGEAEPDKRLPKITKKWSAIWSDEPPTLHVLEAIAYNAARRTLEYKIDESTLIEIRWYHSWTRNLSSWESFEPLTRAERAERAGKASDGLRWWQRPRPRPRT